MITCPYCLDSFDEAYYNKVHVPCTFRHRGDGWQQYAVVCPRCETKCFPVGGVCDVCGASFIKTTP